MHASIVTLCLTLFSIIAYSQVERNGEIDGLEEFSVIKEVPFVMPDGTKLMTDVSLPILQDCLMVKLDGDVNVFGIDVPLKLTLEMIPRGTQIVIYDSANGVKLDDTSRYQLPFVLTRTPYRKKGDKLSGAVFNLMGYAYGLQDMRGRYESEGLYFPMYSDSWNKNAYHNDVDHINDPVPLSDPRNSNRHEDGYNSIRFILDSLRVPEEYNVVSSGEPITNGILGMFGASALGNTQLQAALAHKIDPNGPGLKALLPIVATTEHYNSTGYPNGCFRERLVTGWLNGQIIDLKEEEDIFPEVDGDPHNNIHTPEDFGFDNRFQVGENAVGHFCCIDYDYDVTSAYPNSPLRADMDASRAPVNADGESVAADGVTPLPDLNYSRYTNMEVPIYHVTGWWDIYPDGQIQTFLESQKHLSDVHGNKPMQKIIIGPWAHQTTAGRRTGDMEFPAAVSDFIKISIDDIDFERIPLDELLQSEFVTWFRYNLNHNRWKDIGEPKYIIPKSNKWQRVNDLIDIKVPAEDYILTFSEVFNFMNGTSGLNNIKAGFKLKPMGWNTTITLPDGTVPASGSPIIPGLENVSVDDIQIPDFPTEIPNVRFWVVGNDSADIENTGVSAGNYWFPAHSFPIDHAVTKRKMYLHADGSADFQRPTRDEGFSTYVHDPDDPIVTVGGGNMLVRTPDGSRESQGPMNLANAQWSHLTMDRPGVLQYVGDEIQDSLCIIGYPIATIHAKSNPAGAVSGPTNTEFYVRVLDVYPDGREFIIVEGGVNARARDYARNLAEGYENDEAPFTNIEIGRMYEYKFRLMPIAHTFAKGHKVKILISSSNHPRYQSCPNLPIEDGDYFRRYPNDGRGYTYNGEYMYPRVAVNRIQYSNAFGANSTNIELPIFHGPVSLGEEEVSAEKPESEVLVYPNPASESVNVFPNTNEPFTLRVYNSIGQRVLEDQSNGSYILDVRNYNKGMYVVEMEFRSGNITKQKVAIQ